MTEDKKNEIEVIEITEEYMKEKLYEFRGRKVMLDSDLAGIYGYETKNFKRQVKNNIAKFEGDDFMFELNDEEVEIISRCKNFTLNNGRGLNIKYKPYVFTEQGIYMLMTVLRGKLAIKQSRALVSTFKKLKDYILENRDLIGQREVLQLSMETANNKHAIIKINHDMSSLEKQISDVAEGLKDVVTKSELADMMNSFMSEDDDKWLMFNAKFSSADEVFESIYRKAKRTIYVVDNYIGLRTLVHLKNTPAGVQSIIFSDNVGANRLHNIEFTDFCKEYPTVQIKLHKTGGVFHDRFIVLDYGTNDERVFICGASSKDAGAKITAIVEDYGIAKYKPMIASLLKNPPLVLPK
ncbi:MAG: ORF6N domain-containing protein [Lachnospiraceae bacterium]|nr:ORF6N domain-containing protein [Lachnospiraceae bacterium]